MVLSLIFLGGLMSWTIPCHAVAALLLPVLTGMMDAGDIGQDSNFGVLFFWPLPMGRPWGASPPFWAVLGMFWRLGF